MSKYQYKLLIDNNLYGNFYAQSPIKAASKMFKRLFRMKSHNADNVDELKITIVRICAFGPKKYMYKASKIDLIVPETYSIGNGKYLTRYFVIKIIKIY